MRSFTRLTPLLTLAAAVALPFLGCSAGGGSSSTRKTYVDVEASDAFVRVSVPAPGTFRVRLSESSDFPEVPSFAVDPEALAGGADFTVDTSEPGAVVVRTAQGAVRVRQDPLQIALLDAAGNVVAAEAQPVVWEGQGARVSWSLAGGEHVYGLGDKTGGLDRAGHAYEMWNMDHYGWTVTGAESDPLYKSIPSFVFLKDGAAHGLFIDNPSRARVDVGATDATVLSYAPERAATVDLYLFAGPAPRDVLSAFTALTGRTPLPPRWALGYQQCRYSYVNEADARDVAAKLRAEGIPADAIWLDIMYQDRYAPFTVDPVAFPSFAGMIADFSAAGLNTVLITDLHIRAQEGDPQYDGGLAGDHFIHTLDGDVLEASVWPANASPPSKSVFPEFTRASTRAWWGTLYQDFVADGVAGFWNDMNEPAVFTWLDTPNDWSKTLPDDTPHRLDDGTTVDHVTVHNAYGLENARATAEGLLALRPDTRPFVLTRAAYAGSQRWAATWTGDNTASRDHLAVTIPQLLNLGVSGYAFAGADVGGYSGCPSSDLLVEWMELGALQPFFRNHSEYGTCRREPWLWGADAEARIRSAVERRIRLLPYLYTAFEETARTGVPVMRPLWLEYPADASAATNERAYLLGRDLLVAPKLVAGSAPYHVQLPADDWWDTATGKRVQGGGDVTVTPSATDSVRLFARAGAILPGQPVMPAAAAVPQGALTVDVWPGARCSGGMYLDDGRSFGYRDGAFERIAYACDPTAAGITVTSRPTGAFGHWWSATRVVIHGAEQPSAVTSASGARLPWSFDGVTHTLTVALDGDGADWTVQALWGPFAIPAAAAVDKGKTVQLSSSAAATWESLDPAVCSVVDGLVTGLSVGTCDVKATSAADPAQTATCTVTVNPAWLTSLPDKVYLKGTIPGLPAWSGADSTQMHLAGDYTWQLTYAIPTAGTCALKFVASRTAWPMDFIFSPDPGVTPGADGLSGHLLPESNAAFPDKGSIAAITLTVEAATYLFTFHEDTLLYEIVKQ
jgi:alpha-glucosidase